MTKTRWAVFLGLGTMFCILWVIGIKSLDPDFGWHLKVGNILLAKGLPNTDPFSYTMPSFPWVDHGRLSDVVIAWLYPRVGMYGLAAIFALLVTGAIAVIVPIQMWVFGLVPFLMGAGTLAIRFGVRPQVEDWLGVALLLRITAEDNLWKKWRRVIPILFILWANFHGGFVVGLGIVAVRVLAGWWEAKKFNLKDGGVLICSLMATLINPYGIRLWEEIWLTMSDTNLRFSIAEWQPFFMKAELGYWLVATLTGAMLKMSGGRIPKWRWLLLVILFLGSLSSLRNVPFFILAAIPVTAELFNQAYEIIKKNELSLSRAKKFYLILVIIAAMLFGIDVGIPTRNLIINGGMTYPKKAVDFLQNTGEIKGRLFSDYGWGGYLIWKLPQEKVFVDGRMPSWRWSAPAGESSWAFKDYQKVVADGDYVDIFKKYNVQTVLWWNDKEPANKQTVLVNSQPGWWKWLINKTEGKPKKGFIEKMKEAGWIKEYEDSDTVIYISPPSTN